MKNVIQNPQNELPVICVKIMDEKFIHGFINEGIIHFSNPKTWRDKRQCDGKQLDEMDGCFCSSQTQIGDELMHLRRNFTEEIIDGKWSYFENTDLIVGTCFYGIHLSEFQEGTMKYGVKEISTRERIVPKEYFTSFNKAENTSNKVVVIFDFPKLKELIIRMNIPGWRSHPIR